MIEFNLAAIVALCCCCCCCCLVAPASAGETNSEAATEPRTYSQAFDELIRSEKDLGMSETLAILKEMRDAYVRENKPSKGDDYLTILSGFIAASEVSENKCNKADLDSLDALVSTAANVNSLKRTSVNKFMQHYSGLQYSICRQRVFDKVRSFRNQCSARQRKHLDSLLTSVLRETAGTSDNLQIKANLNKLKNFRDEAFVRGVFNSIKQTNFGLGFIFPFVIRWHKKNNYNEFLTHFEKYMKETCNQVSETLGSQMQAFETHLSPSSSQASSQENEELRFGWEWTGKVRICRAIVDNLSELSMATRNTWQKS